MSKEKKIIAAKKAFEYVEEGMKLGLGTGSTADEFTKILSDNVKDGFQITCVPTSENTKKLAESLEIPLGTLEDYNILDLTIDGADEIADDLSLMKGGGGAHTQEKIIATASKNFLCIADQSKIVSKLGSFPIPVEVLSQARSFVARKLMALGGIAKLRHDFITDQGNEILDLTGMTIDDPISLETKINSIPGVVDNGIFGLRKADQIFIG